MKRELTNLVRCSRTIPLKLDIVLYFATILRQCSLVAFAQMRRKKFNDDRRPSTTEARHQP
jgi:hypothetical protein